MVVDEVVVVGGTVVVVVDVVVVDVVVVVGGTVVVVVVVDVVVVDVVVVVGGTVVVVVVVVGGTVVVVVVVVGGAGLVTVTVIDVVADRKFNVSSGVNVARTVAVPADRNDIFEPEMETTELSDDEYAKVPATSATGAEIVLSESPSTAVTSLKLPNCDAVGTTPLAVMRKYCPAHLPVKVDHVLPELVDAYAAKTGVRPLLVVGVALLHFQLMVFVPDMTTKYLSFGNKVTGVDRLKVNVPSPQLPTDCPDAMFVIKVPGPLAELDHRSTEKVLEVE